MRTLLFTLAMLFSVVAFAQQEVQPQYEVEGDMVKATYFHDNGTVAQTGYYLDGKLQGVWKAYDRDGKKIAMGNYEEGKKVGKWFFWEGEVLNEVNYDNSRIASVTQWNNSNPLVINQE